MSTVNPAALSALDKGFKYHYANEVKELIRKESALIDMCEEDKNFRRPYGGRSLIWPLVLDRSMNFGVRDETDFLPGLDTATDGDSIDRVGVDEASLPRAYAYADCAFTEQQMADAHKDFEFFKGWGFARHVKETQDNMKMQLEMMLLGDKTGLLGFVSSASFSTDTTITLQAASTIGIRGRYGNACLYKNMKISFIRATDWNSSARGAKIHSNIGGAGSGVSTFKIASVSGIHDIGASPTITIAGIDLTSGGAYQLASGDAIVLAKSRLVSTTGGTGGAETDLRCFDGLFSFIDDGNLTTKLFNLTRSTYSQVNSQTDLLTTGRQLTWQRLQIMFDKLYRRRGSDDKDIEDEYMLLTERSVRTNYAANEGEAGKCYVQEDRAKKLVAGFKDVTMAFLGNDTLLPWACVNMMWYGHALLMRKKDLKVMWDIPPSVMSADGLQLRQIAGKPVYYMAFQAVGNFKKDEPWLDGRISGLTGAFSA